ncbi:unnamed protein product [Cylicostephanus goldi]|uniref:Secreted protein n=1 Tax=Cylicostephanus goldi TaxID=71465 RepID=A0A3P7LR05_CYLGO|nr:unnamed protein product [Cylicostephanus goldi]
MASWLLWRLLSLKQLGKQLVVALSRYCWCSDRLVNDTPMPNAVRLEHLIPLGGEVEFGVTFCLTTTI